MNTFSNRAQGYPVLIIGGGRGGHALLEMFMEDKLVNVVAIADLNSAAPGIQLARQLGIPTYTDAVKAMQACKSYPDCIVYNLSHDNMIASQANQIFGDQRVASGHEVKLFWHMVTNLKQIKGELEKSQNLLQSVIRNVMDGIITTDEFGDIQGFNPAAEKIFGYTQQEILGKNVSLLLPSPDNTAGTDDFVAPVQTDLITLVGLPGRELMARRNSGATFSMELSISEMMLGGSRYFVGIVRDISDRKQAEQKIAYLALHDYLTGLPNRANFMNVLEQSTLLAERNKYKVAVLFLDLDGFKKINDTLGHDAGDLLLQQVSKRLVKLIRASDTVSRVGGDEFIFILNNIDTMEGVSLVGSNIIAALAEPFDLNGQLCHVGGSIGISIYPDNAENAGKLIKQADEAMYQAKENGKNGFRFYLDSVGVHPTQANSNA